MKNINHTEKPYKTKLDKFIGKIFQKAYNKLGVAGSIFLGLIFLIGLIIFFIRLISNNFFSWFNFDLSDKNEVGDALGGLTAPFIGITGVILTFLAFWVQYKFNKRQTDLYKSDKLDRKIEEYNKLIESFREKNPSSFGNFIVVSNVYIFNKTFEAISHDINNNKIKEKHIRVLLINYFKKSLIEYIGDDYDPLKDGVKLDTDVTIFISSFIEETRTLHRLLYFFLKEIQHLTVDDDEKLMLIESFIQKFLLFNNKSNTNVLYIGFRVLTNKNRDVSKRNTAKDQEIMKKMISDMVIKYDHSKKECLEYIINNLK